MDRYLYSYFAMSLYVVQIVNLLINKDGPFTVERPLEILLLILMITLKDAGGMKGFKLRPLLDTQCQCA